MTTLSLPQLAGANILTHSRMQTFRTCQEKHHNRYELGIRREGDEVYFRMGGACHKGIDLRAKGASTDDAIAIATQGYEVLPRWCVAEEAVHDWMTERETVAVLLSGYFWIWERDGVPDNLRVAEVLESEGAFELPIRNPETGAASTVFRQAGKRDALVRLGDGRVALKETKTVGEDLDPASDYWKRLRLDNQISQYFCAVQDEGKPIDTILYDVIRKPSIAPKLVPILDADGKKIVNDAEGKRVLKENIKKNGEPGAGHGDPIQSGNVEKGWILQQRRETPEEFGKRLLEDITARPEFYYARQEIPRLDADLARFRADLWDVAATIREARNNGRHYRNTAACTLMGRCEYLDQCHAGIDPDNPPAGFVRVTNLHPELSGD